MQRATLTSVAADATAVTEVGPRPRAQHVRRPRRRRHRLLRRDAQAGRGLPRRGNDSFGRFWERGEHSVGLGVDTANETGAFRLYERAGMRPVLCWVVYEKQLGEVA